MRIARVVTAACTLALAGCAVVPEQPRVIALENGQPAAASAACDSAATTSPAPATATATATRAVLPSGPLRVLSWNLYKGQASGWQNDLAHYAAEHDLLLLQEAVLTAELRRVLEGSGQRWQMAAAFAWGDVERGVMLAARTAPVATCTLRSFEPLFPLPKSSLVARYALAGRSDTLAVANLHGVNFELGASRFAQQLEAVAGELAGHRGPMILAGDFNAWSAARDAALIAVARRLGLEELRFDPDHRRTAFGRHLDRFFVRGLVVRWSVSPVVTSSDHNPLRVVLDLLP